MAVRSTLAIIVLAELFGTSLWLSANAVADQLHTAWGLTLPELGHLTSAVQLGFITGTLVIGVSGFADRYPASRIFAGAEQRVQPVLQTRGRCMPAILQACLT